jgi:hypothetical protein
MAKIKKTKQKFPKMASGNYFDTVKSLTEALKEMTKVMEKTINSIEVLDRRLRIMEGKYGRKRRDG